MRTLRTLSIITLVAAAMASSGCSESDRAWKDAQEVNTIKAYLSYQQSYPQSSHMSEATEAIRLLRWKQAIEKESMLDIEAYISEYPDAPNIDEARMTLEKYSYMTEIGAMNERVKEFLNGNTKNNTISSLNGAPFVEKDQNPSTGMVFFGASNLRVSTKIRNPETGKVLSCVYQPKPNQMVESVEAITPEEGVTIMFTSGHKYEYIEGKWKMNGNGRNQKAKEASK